MIVEIDKNLSLGHGDQDYKWAKLVVYVMLNISTSKQGTTNSMQHIPTKKEKSLKGRRPTPFCWQQEAKWDAGALTVEGLSFSSAAYCNFIGLFVMTCQRNVIYVCF